jgi:hypothetical protein
MKFYVAGKFLDYERVRKMVDFLVAHGHEPSYDWTRTDEFGENGHPVNQDPHAIPEEKLRWYADNDVRGAQEAEFMVILADGDLCGAWIEMGVALTSDNVVRIFVLTPSRYTIFLNLEKVRVLSSYEEFFNLVEAGL